MRPVRSLFNMRGKGSIKRAIDEIVRRVAEQFAPEQIILFGSHATGTADRDSDLDLLVVMPVQGSKRDKAVEIGVALHDIPVPMDIIVTTPEDFEWRKEIVGTIERPASLEGRVLYARH
jgi:predicted nucleotidyltransferase